MVEFSPKPKVLDGIILSGSFCSMGASQVYPHLNQSVALLLFWGGLAGMVLFPLWRWGLHYAGVARWSKLRGFSDRVLLHDAALWAYEQLEKSGLDPMTSTNYSSAKVPLTSCKFMLIYTLDDVQLFGVRAPSTSPRLIPRTELKGLHPSDDNSDLLPTGPRDGPGYQDVRIKRSDIMRVLADYLALLRRNQVT